jgi:di/tricarboxylate transporter
MCSTALLSMFISNTSTAALMVSLVLPILKHERPEQTLSKDSSLDQEEPIISSDDIPLDGASSLRGEANSKYGRSLLLAVRLLFGWFVF